ncbi:alanine:cation symporter family protein, partial [Clostridioides difficile]|uniref:alanine:cation symporter family protein n=1 Tax=Clostridioides difficile TaxID=1496 RepID=UPI00117B0727
MCIRDSAFNNEFGISKMARGISLGSLTSIVIFGGLHRVAEVSEIIVPVFAELYILVALDIVVMNITEIP